jgi:hypothetical protein
MKIVKSELNAVDAKVKELEDKVNDVKAAKTKLATGKKTG